ncbi:hypothetical protein GQ600_7883 [Phytophthora cactorum]|nr:hypothetical protein GQ600_7883 [Phytophthora cactorum]
MNISETRNAFKPLRSGTILRRVKLAYKNSESTILKQDRI